MGLFEELKMYGRYLRDLPAFYRQRMTAEDAKEQIRRALDNRENSFLLLVKRGIYNHSKSAYLAMLNQARVEFEDLSAMVRSRGIEATLGKLRDEGVYVSFDEFKGRVPLVRNGKTISRSEHAFDNPYLIPFTYNQSSGTTGNPTRVPQDLRNTAEAAVGDLLMRLSLKIHDVPHAVWRGVHPDGTGVNRILLGVRFRRLPEVWYSQLNAFDLRPSSLKFTVASWIPVLCARAMGHPAPFPRTLHSDNPYPVLNWIVSKLETEGACAVQSVVSRCLRICIAAQKQGVDLTGATFVMGGETPSASKVDFMRKTGAAVAPTYAMAETGRLGIGCNEAGGHNDIHFFKHRFAILKRARYAPQLDRTVDAFMLTSLSPSAPRILLNVEMDDCGVIEERACGCPIGEIGLTTHVSDIYSYRKITTEGVTLPGSDAAAVIEEFLPRKFGGTPLDYQLIEEEDEEGFTRLYLTVSPEIDLDDGSDIVRALLERLSKGCPAAEQAAMIWEKAGTIRLRRCKPMLTKNGKFHSVRHNRLPRNQFNQNERF